MKLFIVAFGRLKTPGLRPAADHYLKMLRPWVSSLEEIELKPIPVEEKSAESRLLIQRKEGELLLDKISQKLSPRGQFFLLDETGRSRPTRDWAANVNTWEGESVPEVAFCIGSSLGFSAEARKRAQGAVSFGPQTLSHELARVVLLEQLYRAWSVTRGHPYHNEGS